MGLNHKTIAKKSIMLQTNNKILIYFRCECEKNYSNKAFTPISLVRNIV